MCWHLQCLLDEEAAKKQAGDPSGLTRKQRAEHLGTLDTLCLKDNIARLEQSREMIGTTQQLGVGVLRERKVTWAEIGDALGVSREAARQRFGSVHAGNSRSRD